MKATILFVMAMFLALFSYSQSTVHLRGDTIKVWKQGGYADLVVLNRTKDSTNGVLTNIGNGVTRFFRFRERNDSLFLGLTFIANLGKARYGITKESGYFQLGSSNTIYNTWPGNRYLTGMSSVNTKMFLDSVPFYFTNRHALPGSGANSWLNALGGTDLLNVTKSIDVLTSDPSTGTRGQNYAGIVSQLFIFASNEINLRQNQQTPFRSASNYFATGFRQSSGNSSVATIFRGGQTPLESPVSIASQYTFPFNNSDSLRRVVLRGWFAHYGASVMVGGHANNRDSIQHYIDYLSGQGSPFVNKALTHVGLYVGNTVTARKRVGYWIDGASIYNYSSGKTILGSDTADAGDYILQVKGKIYLTQADTMLSPHNILTLDRTTNTIRVAEVPDPVGFVTEVELVDSLAAIRNELNTKDTLKSFIALDSFYHVMSYAEGGADTVAQFKVSESLKDSSIRSIKLKNTRFHWDIFEEFVGSGYGGNFSTYSANSGGAFTVAATSVNHFGEAQVQTSNGATARGAITTSENIIFNSNTYRFEVDDLFLNALNSGTDSISLLVGFFDNSNSDNMPVDGAYVRYDAGSVNWQICTRNNSTETHQTTSSLVSASTNYRVTCVVSSSSASFFINGVQIGTSITTNIPQSVGRDVAMGVKIMKRGGTGYRAANFDRFKFRIDD